MGFNIGSQQGGIINNVAGDQTIAGGQTNVVAFDAAAARGLLAQLRAGVDGLALDEPVAREATAELDGIEGELASPEPDQGRVAERLERLTRILGSVGALATAAGALSPPIGALAAMLGAAAQPILRLLS